MSEQLTLFDLPRAKPRKLMHVFDAGPAETGGHMIRFHCARCDHETDWMLVATVTEAKRGIPCPRCNAKGQATSPREPAR